jgi:hypothetical protein
MTTAPTPKAASSSSSAKDGVGATTANTGANNVISSPRPCSSDGHGHDEFYPFGGVEAELKAFGRLLVARTGGTGTGTGHHRRKFVDTNKPEAALCDLEVLEALLQSGSKSGEPVVVSRHRHHQ